MLYKPKPKLWKPSRRAFIRGLVASIAAPYIVKAQAATTKLGGTVGIGHANRFGSANIVAFSSATSLQAANSALIMVGHFEWEDNGSHTIDTTGASSIQWLTGTSLFANAGTTVKVGIAPVDTSNGPPARASNAAGVISFDVAASFIGGGGGITSGAWQTSVPTSGSKTIATGDLVAIALQMTARGGADQVLISASAMLSDTIIFPAVTTFLSGSYGLAQYLPNALVVASDGTLGWLYGSYIATVGATAQQWNSGSATKEYGNILRFPVPARADGVVLGGAFVGDCDFILYSDPLGTPVAQRTVPMNFHTWAQTTGAVSSNGELLFASTLDLAANTDYAIIAKPTSVTNVQMNYKTFNAATDQASELLGTNCYAINRASGAFAAQNSSKDRFAIGLLIGAFGNNVSGGGIIGG